MTEWQVVKLGAQYAGPCVACRSRIEGHQLADALLLKRRDLGRDLYAVMHARCAGLRTVGKVKGGRSVVGSLPETVEV